MWAPMIGGVQPETPWHHTMDEDSSLKTVSFEEQMAANVLEDFMEHGGLSVATHHISMASTITIHRLAMVKASNGLHGGGTYTPSSNVV